MAAAALPSALSLPLPLHAATLPSPASSNATVGSAHSFPASRSDASSGSSVSSSKRRHREVDSRRRQREADLLRRLHALGGGWGAHGGGGGGEEEDSDVVVVIDEEGKARRRRVQKLDILEQALERMESMQRAMEAAAVAQPQPQAAAAATTPAHTLAMGSEWGGKMQPTVTTTTSTSSTTVAIASTLVSQLSPSLHRFPQLSLSQPPTLHALSSASFAYPPRSPRSSPPPSVFHLPLDRHVHRSMAEWYEEAYRHSPSAYIAQNIALHWQQAAISPPTTAADELSTDATCASAALTPLPALLAQAESSESQLPFLSVPSASESAQLLDLDALIGSTSASATATLYCRYRAIYWLRVAALSVVEQRNAMPRDVVVWLRCAADFIDSLPDHQSTAWRRELLHTLALYCSAYSVFTGITRTFTEWSRLRKLCLEVQQSAEAKTGRPDDDSTVRSNFYSLGGYHLALAADARNPINLEELTATSAKLTAIAHASGDYLMLSHALYVEAIEHIHHSRYEQAVRTSLRAWQLCLPYYRPAHAYTVNPLAPIDPGIGALLCAANALCVLGRMAEAAEYADRGVAHAFANEEPITYQWSLGMRSFVLSQLGDLHTPAAVERYTAYYDCTRSSEQGPTSTLYETCYALHRATVCDEADVSTVRLSAARWWQRFQEGDSFITAFSSPLCELLHRAGMWCEGLQLTDQWAYLSRGGELSFYYSDCHRYRALFLLQKARHLRGSHEPSSPTIPPTQPLRMSTQQSEGFDFSFSPWLASAAPSSEAWPASPPSLQLDPLDESTELTPQPAAPAADSTPASAGTEQWLALYDEAVDELKAAVKCACSTQARLLEVKAILDLLPLLQQLPQLDSDTALPSPATPPVADEVASDASFQRRLRVNMHEAELKAQQRRLGQLMDECGKGNEAYGVVQRAHEMLAPFFFALA